MIKIKDYIFNGNEIKMFIDGERIKVVFKNDTHIYIDANYEDIEWNYQDKETNYLKYREKELKHYNEILDNQYQDKLKKIEELEEENEKLKEVQCTFLGTGCKRRLQELEEENKKLKEEYITLEKDYGTCELENDKLRKRINKAIEYIKDNVSVYSFGNKSEDYAHWEFNDENIFDLLKILKGEENE